MFASIHAMVTGVVDFIYVKPVLVSVRESMQINVYCRQSAQQLYKHSIVFSRLTLRQTYGKRN